MNLSDAIARFAFERTTAFTVLAFPVVVGCVVLILGVCGFNISWHRRR